MGTTLLSFMNVFFFLLDLKFTNVGLIWTNFTWSSVLFWTKRKVPVRAQFALLPNNFEPKRRCICCVFLTEIFLGRKAPNVLDWGNPEECGGIYWRYPALNPLFMALVLFSCRIFDHLELGTGGSWLIRTWTISIPRFFQTPKEIALLSLQC